MHTAPTGSDVYDIFQKSLDFIIVCWGIFVVTIVTIFSILILQNRGAQYINRSIMGIQRWQVYIYTSKRIEIRWRFECASAMSWYIFMYYVSTYRFLNVVSHEQEYIRIVLIMESGRTNLSAVCFHGIKYMWLESHISWGAIIYLHIWTVICGIQCDLWSKELHFIPSLWSFSIFLIISGCRWRW